MANIGSFKKVGIDFQGGIVTLSVQAKGIRIVAEPILQLRRWPSPGPDCVVRGGHFVRTWVWTAPKLLSQLANQNQFRGN